MMIRLYLKDETGATAIEYGLIAALIGVSIITAATAVGVSITDMFGVVGTTLS